MNGAVAAFDSLVVNGTEISGGRLVSGSASLSIGGSGKSAISSDGYVVHVRETMTRNASFKALGDFSGLTTPAGWSVAVSLRLDGVELAAFNAMVSVAYDSNTRSSSFVLKGEPQEE
jgi:hypothetical protein